MVTFKTVLTDTANTDQVKDHLDITSASLFELLEMYIKQMKKKLNSAAVIRYSALRNMKINVQAQNRFHISTNVGDGEITYLSSFSSMKPSPSLSMMLKTFLTSWGLFFVRPHSWKNFLQLKESGAAMEKKAE